MRADGGWCCSILWYYHAHGANWWSNREKWLDQRTTLSDCSFFTMFPYFQYWMEWKLPWHEFQPLLLCIILMLGPEGPVKRILSNVPWNWNFPLRLDWHSPSSCCYHHPALYIFGKFNQLLHCWSNWQIGNIVTSGKEGHTVTQAPISNNTLPGTVTGYVL